MREGDRCACDDGWDGINCNMCTDDRACDSLMEMNEGGVCYQMGNLLKNNYQMCDVTNEKIRDLLGAQIPQVTFTCDASNGRCDFQCTPHYLSPGRLSVIGHCTLTFFF